MRSKLPRAHLKLMIRIPYYSLEQYVYVDGLLEVPNAEPNAESDPSRQRQ